MLSCETSLKIKLKFGVFGLTKINEGETFFGCGGGGANAGLRIVFLCGPSFDGLFYLIHLYYLSFKVYSKNFVCKAHRRVISEEKYYDTWPITKHALL